MKWIAELSAWLAALVVALIVTAPEILKIPGGSPGPNHLMGYGTARLFIAFIIAGFMARTDEGFSHWRFNLAAPGLGLLIPFLQLRAKGVW